MSNPVNVLGKYGMGPWGTWWGAIWYIEQDSWWGWWNWWSRWTFYRFSDKSRWIWNQPNANQSAPANVPVHFKYTYHNNTGSEIQAWFYYIADNEGKIYVNGKQIVSDWWYSDQRIPFTLLPGKNVIEAHCMNLGWSPNPAGFIADVRRRDNKELLFSTNNEWVYETNFTKDIFDLTYCGKQNLTNGYATHNNVGFDLKDDNKDFKNGSYLLLARQTLPHVFDKRTAHSHKYNTSDPNNDNYMNGNLLNDLFKIDGKYTFRLVWPGSGLQHQIWRQESNPFHEKTVRGYEGIYIPYTQNYWDGLRFNGRQCVLSGSSRAGWWWYAIGSFQKWGGGIPSSYKAVQKVELYVLKGDIGNYTSLGHQYIPTNNIKTNYNIPHDECANECDRMSDCNGFSMLNWWQNNKGCQFKNGASNKFKNWGTITYTKKPDTGALKDEIIKSDQQITPIGAYGDSWNRALPAYLGNVGYNKEACAQRAKDNGYRYFGLQCPGCGVQCFAGNDLNRAEMYGRRNSGPYGAGWVNYVYDTEGSGNDSTLKDIGPYKDTGNRALRYGPHQYGYTAETCKAACPQYKYIGLQNGNGKTGWCCCDNSFNHATKYGKSNCGKTGGPWCNYIYEKVPKKKKSLNTEYGCSSACNKNSECIGYSFDKNKATNNCRLFKKVPKFYYKKNGGKIGFKPKNISNFNSLSREKQNTIKKKCGSDFLSNKYGMDKDAIEKCIQLNESGSKTTGFNVDAKCLYDNLEKDSSFKKKKLKNTGLDNMAIIGAKKNKAIDENIDNFYKYVDKNTKFSNYNNKEVLIQPDNNQQNVENAVNVYKSGGLEYLQQAEEYSNEISEKVNSGNESKETFQNMEEEHKKKIKASSYLENIKYNGYIYYIILIVCIILMALMYHFNV